MPLQAKSHTAQSIIAHHSTVQYSTSQYAPTVYDIVQHVDVSDVVVGERGELLGDGVVVLLQDAHGVHGRLVQDVRVADDPVAVRVRKPLLLLFVKHSKILFDIDIELMI
jgi:hypothetical protein